LLDTQGNVLSSNPPARQVLKAQKSDQFPSSVKDFLSQIETIAGVSKAEIEIDERTFHITAAPVAGTGMVLTMHDVTHFKQLARMKDEFVATVSHDLRSPLNSILGNIEIAQEESMLEEEHRDALERAKRIVYRMAALINNLLDLAEVEAGIPLRLTPIELDDLAREAAQDLEYVAAGKGISIQYRLDQLPPINADQQLIMRVWHNLIDNAIKYTPEGTITVGVEASENQVMGYVADTGVGIPSSDLPFVFDKFFRVDQPQTRDIAGTGLGLALVKSIVEKHRGQIWVESEPDTGSTFTFTLPI